MPSTGSRSRVGRVQGLWRYPVRSLGGERVTETRLGPLGVAGDRAWSILDPGDGHMATAAKRPRDWAGLLGFSARYLREPSLGDARAPDVELRHESGTVLRSDAGATAGELARLLGRKARLHAGDAQGALSAAATAERDPGAPRPPYASAPIHLLTTSSLCAAKRLHPAGAFEIARFRPNILVDTGGAPEFLEAGWVEACLRIGDEVVLHVFKECERCVLTTLPQPGLPRDPHILATAVGHNRTFLGVSCSVPSGGVVREGDPVVLEAA